MQRRQLTSKLLDASHMAGFDVPHVTNDMMLRFMGVDFTLVPGIAAGSESKVGKVDRVHLGIAGERPGGVPILKGGNSGTEGESYVFRHLGHLRWRFVGTDQKGGCVIIRICAICMCLGHLPAAP